jgi:hypothetical protein
MDLEAFKKSKIEPASFLAFRELVFTARHGVNVTPEVIAERHNLWIERSVEDQLGYYHFVGFQKGEYYFGMRRLLDSPVKNTSMVSVLGAPPGMERLLISHALNINYSDIVELDCAE